MSQEILLYEGKAKSVFSTKNPGELRVVFRDDITAFDGEKKDNLSGKGALNASVSSFFFRYLEEKGIKTHYLRDVDENTMVVKRLKMLPLEVIPRNRAAGSIVRRYPFNEGQSFERPVIVIDYKDDERHDPMLNDDIIIALGIVSEEELEFIKKTALEINSVLCAFFEGVGLDLVDFKIEFGRYEDEILLGDEISMDSMRLWDRESGESMDKDVYRYEKGDLISAYERVVSRIGAFMPGGLR